MSSEHDGSRLLQSLGALIDMQKQLLSSLASATAKHDRIEAELTKLSRQGPRLEEQIERNAVLIDAVGRRLDDIVNAGITKMPPRLDAIGRRLDDMEQAIDQNITETKSIQIEILGMKNEILNALQSGLFGQAEIRELRERIEALERRIGQ